MEEEGGGTVKTLSSSIQNSIVDPEQLFLCFDSNLLKHRFTVLRCLSRIVDPGPGSYNNKKQGENFCLVYLFFAINFTNFFNFLYFNPKECF